VATKTDGGGAQCTKEKHMLPLVETEKDPVALESKLKQRMSGTIPDALIGMAK
jgi:hypothetical protein